MFVRLALGVFFTLNLMALSWFFYARDLYFPDAAGASGAIAGLFSALGLLLTTLVVATLGVPLVAAWSRSRERRLDRFTLILLGVGAAYVVSVLRVVRGEGHLYFDAVALILVLVTLGSWVEATAKRRAAGAALERLSLLPVVAWVRRGDDVLEVREDELRVGDVVRVRASENVAVDGGVADGAAHVDEAALTGEPRPRAIAVGDTVLAGSLCLDGTLWVVAKSVGPARAAERMREALARARERKPRVQRAADRAAALFVPGVVVLALVVFATHAFAGDAARGLFDALAVLLVSCPCALGIAAPLATSAALERAARMGVVIDSAETLERAAAIDTVFFDKTGTLTERRLRLTAIDSAPDVPLERALAWAAALEAASVHPIADALVAAARARNLVVPKVDAARVLPGRGVTGEIDGRCLTLGSQALARERFGEAGDVETPVLIVQLMDRDRVLARFSLEERLRESARPAVAALTDVGVRARVVSGDGSRARVLDALGIPVAGGLLPDEKLALLQRERCARRVVAMVGDGLNDAPILAAADVGFALASGTDLARSAGNVRLISDDLGRVPETLALARRTMRVIQVNLGWAFGYNLIAVALAARGSLTPVIAALVMLFSSLFVLHNSGRAGRPLEPALGRR